MAKLGTKIEPVFLTSALKTKFKKACALRRVILFSANCGCGKTTAVRELTRRMRVLELSALQQGFQPPEETESWDILFLDDLQELQDGDEQAALCNCIRDNPEKQFILATRGSAVPGWLIQFQFAGLMEVITGDDLRLDRECVRSTLEKDEVEVTDATLDEIMHNCLGYPLAVSTLARRLKQADGEYTSAVISAGRLELYRYWECAIFHRLSAALQSFCMDLSSFSCFTTDLAKVVTGESRASDLIEQIKLQTGMLVSQTMELHHFLPEARRFLNWELERNYSEDQKKSLYSRAGLYYELCSDYSNALAFYSKSGDIGKVSRILEKNARTHVGMGHYQEMAAYYHALSEKEVLASPVLMQGMSMLCALETNYEASERWYTELKRYQSGHHDKEARGRLAWLDVCLPQRDVTELTKTIPAIFHLISHKEITVGPMSVTSALPSIMNGGKDFSEWSKIDDLLYATIRVPVVGMLGADGVGLPDTAIAESKFEKGENVSAQVLSLMTQLSEVQRSGTPDLEFALVGLVARVQAANGYATDAWNTVSALRARYEARGLSRFLPNMDALLCRLALLRGDMAYVRTWYEEKAPRDPFQVWVMKRYQYLTEAMVELMQGRNDKALMTLAPLDSYFTACRRYIDKIQLHLLQAIARYRLDDTAWRDDLTTALESACEFHFVRTISQFGASILPLLEQFDWDADPEFLMAVTEDTRQQTTFYPKFLLPETKLSQPLSPAEKRILRLVCADKSNQEIAEVMGVKVTTVKTQVRSIFHKMNVKRRSEAKTAAETLHLL